MHLVCAFSFVFFLNFYRVDRNCSSFTESRRRGVAFFLRFLVVVVVVVVFVVAVVVVVVVVVAVVVKWRRTISTQPIWSGGRRALNCRCRLEGGPGRGGRGRGATELGGGVPILF